VVSSFGEFHFIFIAAFKMDGIRNQLARRKSGLSNSQGSNFRSPNVKRCDQFRVSRRGWLHRLEGGALKQWKRRWFVLGDYCLFYYSVARCLRPNDSRMIIATGETLEKLERKSDAIKCYWKAGGTALYKLASLYENSNEKDKAAAAFSDFINRAASLPDADSNPDLSHAYKFLANYY